MATTTKTGSPATAGTPATAGMQQQQGSQQSMQGPSGTLETPVTEETSTAVGKAATTETLAMAGTPGTRRHR